MPSGSGGGQQDIRQWMSSTGTPSSFSTPKRRRRVMTTTDSEEDRGQHSRQAQTPQTLPRPASQESAAAAISIDGNVIILETSSDDMREAAVGGADSRRQRKGIVELFQATLPLGSPNTRSKARSNNASR